LWLIALLWWFWRGSINAEGRVNDGCGENSR
jgi:hypothetical protein